ncbi:hypothetical protein V5O48_009973 [Marasmius crinis-equi]|uniref:Uncharacterized protein n=1 Tax=Marasmius crinis-equi TaxID=585013 RepID=A0ABR3F9U9_9AGAR
MKIGVSAVPLLPAEGSAVSDTTLVALNVTSNQPAHSQNSSSTPSATPAAIPNMSELPVTKTKKPSGGCKPTKPCVNGGSNTPMDLHCAHYIQLMHPTPAMNSHFKAWYLSAKEKKKPPPRL